MSDRRQTRSPRRGFSLASVLLLTVVVAVFAAAIGRLFQPPRHVEAEAMIAAAILGMAVGVIAGIAIGLRQMRPARGVVLGVASGILAGAASGLMLMAPNSLPIIAVGALVMVCLGAVVRFYSR